MRILTILTYYHPHWTGLTKYAQRLAEGLVARGHDVTVLTSHHDSTSSAQEVLGGVRVVRVRSVARVSRGSICPTLPVEAARLIRDTDVVQIHTPFPEALLIAGICRTLGKPFIMTHHGDLVLPSGIANAVIERAVVSSMTLAGYAAARITVHSRDYAESSDFLHPFIEKLDAIYPLADIPEPDLTQVKQWRAELGLNDHKVIGFAGRFVEEKGFDLLFRAFPAVLAQVPMAHLLYAGNENMGYERFAEQARVYRQPIREHLSSVGLIRDDQTLANFYALCDILAVPSRSDCFPSLQIESMLCGTPVVTTDIPGAREAVNVTGMGRIVRGQDPRSLAEGLVEAVSNPARYHRSREHIQSVFNTKTTLDRYEDVLECAIRGSFQHRVPAVSSPDTRTVRRRGGPPLPFTSLTAQDEATLDRILTNEADMAYRRRAPRLLDYLELQDGDRILDAGCGMGFYLMAMSRLRNLTLTGLDRDIQRLQWAEDEQVTAGLVDANVEALPFGDETFDKMLMSEILEHLDDDRQGLREAYRVLKPGGILSISVPNAKYPWLWDPINRTWTLIGGEPFRNGPLVGMWSLHRRLYRAYEIESRVREAGFEVEIVEELTHHAFPFSHFIVYGIGKPLIEHGVLPQSLRDSADRFRGERNSRSLLNPINLGVAVMRSIDKLNDLDRREHDTFVNILVKARRPK